jgi:hypothetical protein
MESSSHESFTDALMLGFPDASGASLAYVTLQELGYSPVRHGSGEIHIHINRGDLTSALEIAMAHGGHPLDRESIRSDELFCSTYDMDAIPIPAHFVNEDWGEAAVDGGNAIVDAVPDLQNRDAEGDPGHDLLPGHDDYGFFSGDVKA